MDECVYDELPQSIFRIIEYVDTESGPSFVFEFRWDVPNGCLIAEKETKGLSFLNEKRTKGLYIFSTLRVIQSYYPLM